MDSQPAVQTTIDLPDLLVRRARLKALHPGRPFKDLVAEYIRRGLSEWSATPSGPTSGALVIADDGLRERWSNCWSWSNALLPGRIACVPACLIDTGVWLALSF